MDNLEIAVCLILINSVLLQVAYYCGVISGECKGFERFVLGILEKE